MDYSFHTESKYNTQKLMKQKKIKFVNTKFAENIGKPKELWKSLKALGLAFIKSPLTNICLKTKDDVTNFVDKKMLKYSRNIFAH